MHPFADNEDRWKKAKQEHQRLSDVAASEYDDLYASSNFATGSYMAYELETIDRAVAYIDKNNRRIALDLGCGTGRDAFYFHKHFAQVRAYDFSAEMIRIAQQKKLQKSAGNVQFIVRDIEEDLLTDIENATVSFVGSGFGMGSFIRDLGALLREVKRVLEPGGIFVVSFYNRESLVVQIDTLEWAPSLSARLDGRTGFLAVTFKGELFNVAVRPYSVKEVQEKLQHYFEVIDVSTFPTLSSLFPNSIFTSKQARELCTIVDKALRSSPDIAGGPYIIAICRKRGKLDVEPGPIGYMNIMRLLNDNRILPNIREHAPVKSTDEVAELLGIERTVLIKSILIKIKTPDVAIAHHSMLRYYAVVLQANRFMDYAKVAELLRVPRHNIDLATTDEVEEMTGFSVGGIPPLLKVCSAGRTGAQGSRVIWARRLNKPRGELNRNGVVCYGVCCRQRCGLGACIVARRPGGRSDPCIMRTDCGLENVGRRGCWSAENCRRDFGRRLGTLLRCTATWRGAKANSGTEDFMMNPAGRGAGCGWAAGSRYRSCDRGRTAGTEPRWNRSDRATGPPRSEQSWVAGQCDQQ